MVQTSRRLDAQILDMLLQELADIIEPDSMYQLVACGSGALSLFYGVNVGKTNDLDAFNVNLIEYPDELISYVRQVSLNHPELDLDTHWLNDDILRFSDYDGPEFGASEMLYVADEKNYLLYQGRDEYGYETGGFIKVIPVRIEGILLAKFSAYRDKDIPHIHAIIDYLDLRSEADIIALLKTYVTKDLEKKPYWSTVSNNIYEYCIAYGLETSDYGI